MPSKTFAVNADARLLSPNLGAGACDHLPVGNWSGDIYRSVLKFSLDWTGVTGIVSATLHFKTTDAYHVAIGGSPRVYAKRITSSWSEGSASHPASSTNAVVYPGPSTTTSGQSDSGTLTTSQNTWDTMDVTAIVTAWAPASIGGGGAANYGLMLQSFDESSTSRTTEFWSRETSSDAYITLNYTSQTVPNAPSLTSPAASSRITTLTPTLAFTHSDPQGDPCVSYAVQVSTDSSFASVTHWNASGLTGGISGNSISVVYAGTALTRGTTYYWRAATSDSTGQGAWSGSRAFAVDQLPTATKVSPASNGLAVVNNLGTDLNVWTSTGNHAKPSFSWTYSDPDGDAQGSFRVRIYDLSSGGSLLNDSGQISGTATSYDSAYAVVMGTTYYWTIEVWDSYGLSSGESSRTAFKVRWGQAIYEYAPGGGATSSLWNFTSAAMPSNTRKAMLFASATGAGGVGRSVWYTDIGQVDPNTYLNVLVRLAADVSGSVPILDSMQFSYLGSAIQPDCWVMNPSTDWMLDSSIRRYGTVSMRCLVATTSGDRYVYPFRQASGDDILVQQNTTYTFSALVKINGTLASGAALRLMVYATGGLTTVFADGGTGDSASSATNTSAYTEGWKRLSITFKTGAGVTKVRPVIHYKHNGTTSGDKFWVDGTKFEEGSVASAWTPGFIADAVVLDANGIMVDGAAGGIFRLRGTAGGSRDIVQLGAHGLVFGGDTQVYSDSPRDLFIDGKITVQDSSLFVNGLEVTGSLAADSGVTIPSGPLLVYVPFTGTFTNDGASGVIPASTSQVNIEMTNVPANNANIVAVSVTTIVRDNSGTAGAAGGANTALSIYNYSGSGLAGVAYAFGIFQRGGGIPAFYVQVGGANNRQIKVAASAANNTCVYWVGTLGWWIKA